MPGTETGIVGYTYKADVYCPDCIIGRVSKRHDLGYGNARLTTEGILDKLAGIEGIDRLDEWTFDSGDFPKVIDRYMDCDEDRCGECGNLLGG